MTALGSRPRRERQGVRDGDPGAPGAPPLLWHLKVSNYNEKARWALDYKRIPHVRRAVVPGRHRRVAAKLTGGSTFPILILDGEAIGESSAIVAALERRHPKPSLYPAEPALRRRALQLERFFDRDLGPHARLLLLDRMLRDPRLMLGAFAPDLTAPRRLAARATFPLIRRRVVADFGIDEDRVVRAYGAVDGAGEWFRACLGPSGYLAGHAFSVADLTLAALVAPLVAPPQFPYPQPQREHPLLAPLRDALSRAGVFEWTLEMYARHRPRSSELVRV